MEGLYVEEEIECIDKSMEKRYSLFAEAFVNTHLLSKEKFFERVFNAVLAFIPEAQKGSFYELEGDCFIPVFAKGYDLKELKKLSFRKDEALIDYESPESQLIDAYEVVINKRDETKFSQETIQVFKNLGTYEKFVCLYAPIKLEGVKVGLLCLENFEMSRFSESSKSALRIYAQMISNFFTLRMNQQSEREKYEDIINALVSAIEVKDKYTEGHAKRVQVLSCAIAQELGLSRDRIKMIESAAILHDVGKIGIPTEILTKTGKLTYDEYEIVKKHTEDTKKILCKIRGFDEIVEFAYLHHEHYDGSGYPLGQKGSVTPIEAQIIQVADAFDAMNSNRAYRSALGKDKILKTFEEQRGKQFNPEVSDVLVKLFLK